MRKLLFPTLNDFVAICITLVLCLPAVRQSNSATTSANQKGAAMSGRATGTFDVNLVPQEPTDKADGVQAGMAPPPYAGMSPNWVMSSARSKISRKLDHLPSL